MIIDFFCYFGFISCVFFNFLFFDFFFNFTFFVGGVGVGGSEERVYFLF